MHLGPVVTLIDYSGSLPDNCPLLGRPLFLYLIDCIYICSSKKKKEIVQSCRNIYILFFLPETFPIATETRKTAAKRGRRAEETPSLNFVECFGLSVKEFIWQSRVWLFGAPGPLLLKVLVSFKSAGANCDATFLFFFFFARFLGINAPCEFRAVTK